MEKMIKFKLVSSTGDDSEIVFHIKNVTPEKLNDIVENVFEFVLNSLDEYDIDFIVFDKTKYVFDFDEVNEYIQDEFDEIFAKYQFRREN